MAQRGWTHLIRYLQHLLVSVFLLMVCAPRASAALYHEDPTEKRGTLTLQWGFHRDFYSSSDIHFVGNGYDFVVHDTKANDRPNFDRFVDLFNTNAQYNFKLAYFITDRLSVGLSFDHMKYVATPGQSPLMSGTISAEASPTHAGTFDKVRTHIGDEDNDIVGHFEHTNGLNLVDVEVSYMLPLVVTRGGWFLFSLYGAASVGFVVPKTDVALFGSPLDNEFHVAGGGMAATFGFRLDLLRFLFFELRVKGGWIRVADALTINGGRADHSFGFVSPALNMGLSFPIGAWSTKP